MLEIIKPMDIEKRSFEIISGILAEQGIELDPQNEPVIKRVIHTTADFDYVKNHVFSENAVQKAREALLAGCDIVLYLVLLCAELGLDMNEVVRNKLADNERRFNK